MPPHCDSLDGPVVRAARAALDGEDVEVVLPYVPEAGEAEVRQAFDLAAKARPQGVEAREVADRFFFETVVRVHRAGEGAPFTGLKPAGLDVGPVIPLAERAAASGDGAELAEFLAAAVRAEVLARVAEVQKAKAHAGDGVGEARRHVSAALGLQVWSHRLYGMVHAPAHEAAGHEHGYEAAPIGAAVARAAPRRAPSGAIPAAKSGEYRGIQRLSPGGGRRRAGTT